MKSLTTPFFNLLINPFRYLGKSFPSMSAYVPTEKKAFTSEMSLLGRSEMA